MSHDPVPSRMLSLSAFVPNVLRRGQSSGDASDAALVARVRDEDPDAFRELFDRHAPAVWRFLEDLVGDKVFADEGVQETFVRAFGAISELREDARLSSWLYGIARNVALEHLRARKRDRPPGATELEPEDAEGAHPPSPELLLLGRETETLMGRALQSLSADRRAALLMRVEHGLGYEEIASAMGWTLPKVKNEIHRARLQLRAELVRFHGGEP